MKYQPSLDGLRAVAVAAVLLYHARGDIFVGGWLGVDVFFVLSGFLITGLLAQEEHDTGGVSLRLFYIRRFLRLTPAFWTVLLFVLTAAGVHLIPRIETLKSVAWSGSYLINWNRAFDLGATGVLGHTWSLAMEEQFYLLWPITFMFIRTRRPLAILLTSIGAIFVWRACLALNGADSERTYNGFDTHADSMLIGCVLAFLPNRLNLQEIARKTSIVPAIGLSSFVVWLPQQTVLTQTVGLTAAGLFSAWIILGSLDRGWLRNMLSWAPLVFTGRISYGLYLWHYPILVIGADRVGSHATPKLLTLSYAVAVCSYFIVERPFLKLKRRFEPDDAARMIQESQLQFSDGRTPARMTNLRGRPN